LAVVVLNKTNGFSKIKLIFLEFIFGKMGENDGTTVELLTSAQGLEKIKHIYFVMV